MAGSLNKVTLIGNVGADPEVRYLNSGQGVANIRIATSESWKNSDGEKQERTEWHSVVVWIDPLIEVIEKFVKKGSKLYIEGALQTRKWQDQNGNDRYSTEVVLNGFNGKLLLLDKREGGGDGERQGNQGNRNNGGGNQRGGGQRQGQQQQSQGGGFSRDLDDEIPF